MSFWNDFRYGARTLRKSPGFAAASAITLALGIGATTVICSASPPGGRFEPSTLLTFRLAITTKYNTPQQRMGFNRDVIERAEAIPERAP